MEQGGPAVAEPPSASGFGSRLVKRSVSQQLGGSIEYDWSRGGLTATLRVERNRLAS